ncbi:MAG: hypothetical protein EBV34_19930 [Betaproteobacteria bacterium]|nr:hypothetical protein [Betaproteobacteria bacterium]
MKSSNTKHPALTREALFRALAPRIETHMIEGLGEVHFRQLSLQEIDTLSKRKQQQGDEGLVGFALLKRSLPRLLRSMARARWQATQSPRPSVAISASSGPCAR